MCSMEPRPPRGGFVEFRWHVSIAHPSRYPTWDEIKTAVYSIESLTLRPGRTFAQLLGDPGQDVWVNAHGNCFHLYEIDQPVA